jgi:hypothetical protein
MKTNNEQPVTARHRLLLFAIRIFGAIWKPTFRLAVLRGSMFAGCLFAPFCASLEVERLGRAFESNRN